MRRMVLIYTLVVTLFSSAAVARIWIVNPDGTGDSETIQYAIELASVGDTVQVVPGEYVGIIHMKDGIVLMSVGGWESTTLSAPGVGQSVIICINLSIGSEVRGFRIEGGGEGLIYGGFKCQNSSMIIAENMFNNNVVGIGCTDCADVEIISNSFISDRGIYCDNSSPSITDNLFSDCYCSRYVADGGAAVLCVNGSSPHVVENTFVGNIAEKRGGAIHCGNGSSATIRNNTFEGNVAWLKGGAIAVLYGSSAHLEFNVFVGNLSNSGDAICVSSNSTITTRWCTFHANGNQPLSCTIGCSDGSEATVSNCILSQGDGVAAVRCWNGGMAFLDCNNLFANVADYEGCDPGPNDFYSDPVFCDPAFGDFSVDCLSPCIGHPICGQVGALGIGCGASAAEATTWGAIKSDYR